MQMNNNIILCATRFTDETYNENINYKNNKKFSGSLYGSPIKISNNIIKMINKREGCNLVVHNQNKQVQLQTK